MQGKPTPLLSSFKLTYYTLINLMRRMEGSGAFDSQQEPIAYCLSSFPAVLDCTKGCPAAVCCACTKVPGSRTAPLG